MSHFISLNIYRHRQLCAILVHAITRQFVTGRTSKCGVIVRTCLDKTEVMWYWLKISILY